MIIASGAAKSITITRVLTEPTSILGSQVAVTGIWPAHRKKKNFTTFLLKTVKGRSLMILVEDFFHG